MSKLTRLFMLSALSAISISSMVAQADNKITFTGTVIDTACTVVVNDGTATLDLGSTVVGDLSDAGKTGAPKIFTVSLNACPAAATGVPTKAYIKFSGTTDGDETYFKNDLSDTDAAKHVGIIIKDKNGTAIVNNDSNTAVAINAAGGNQNEQYTASLVATATGASKGKVSSAVTYNVSYE